MAGSQWRFRRFGMGRTAAPGKVYGGIGKRAKEGGGQGKKEGSDSLNASAEMILFCGAFFVPPLF